MSWIERPIGEFFAESRKPSLEEIHDPLRPSLDLLGRLEETEQDPDWHGEGDVLIHTRMVLEELYKHLDGKSPEDAPTDEERAVLVLGAALHDIAKPLVTRRAEIDGRERVVSPRHADLGRSYLAPRLIELAWPFERLWQVLALVGRHHDPLKLVRNDADLAAYRRLARQASPRRLYDLEVADMRGRICADLDRQLEMLDLFALGAEDAGEPPDHLFWGKRLDEILAGESPRVRRLGFLQALRDAENGRVNSPEEAAARAYAFRRPTPELCILCGPAGSGKSTWVKTQGKGRTVVSLDAIRDEISGRRRDKKLEGRVVQEGLRRLKVALAGNEKIVWDATTLRRERRGEIVKLGEAYGAVTTIVAFLLTPAELHSRNRGRAHSIPSDALDRQIRSYDFPQEAESHRLQIVDGDGSVLASFPN